MKFLRRFIGIILIVIIIVSIVIYINGNKMYKTAIEKKNIETTVAEIRNNDNFISFSQVPDYYINAIIAVEDHRFYNHGTIDIISIGRAFISNIRQKNLKEGGSTITQQTAKNLYFISEKNFVNRKVAEVLVGIDLEKLYSKEEILELYFNTIYFGDGYYGIKEACNGYLHKEPSQMTISEATMLAGVPNAPSAYSPTINLELTKSRQKKVISSMVKYNYLREEEANNISLY